jgi:hypothetical protein
MRRIINSTYISLDGVVENPQEWPSAGIRTTARVASSKRSCYWGATPCSWVAAPMTAWRRVGRQIRGPLQ